MNIVEHIKEHSVLGVPNLKSVGSASFVSDTFPAVLAATNSPHTVGFWPMNIGAYVCFRDTSGNRNHAWRFQINSAPNTVWTLTSGALKNTAGGPGLRVSSGPTDQKFDIGAPNASFIAAWQTRIDAVVGGKDQTVFAKGSNNAGAPAGASGILVGMIDNGAGVPRMRVAVSNSSKYSANFPAFTNGTTYHVAVVRDALGAMGAAGLIYVYINGVRDTAFNSGAGSLAYAPTASYYNANLVIGDYGNAVNGNDAGPSGSNDYALLNLYMAVFSGTALPGDGVTPAAMDAVIAYMAANPTTPPPSSILS